MSKNKVEINQKDLKALKKRFDSLEKFDKYLDKELSVTVKESENSAAMAFIANWGQVSGRGNKINSGKTKKGTHYVEMKVLADPKKKGKPIQNYLVFLEFGTRRVFSKARDFRFLRDLGLSDDLIKPFMASPLKRATNLMGKPFFFPALKKAIKNLNKRIEKRLKQITK
jgi:hypothetical protein